MSTLRLSLNLDTFYTFDVPHIVYIDQGERPLSRTIKLLYKNNFKLDSAYKTILLSITYLLMYNYIT